MDSEMGSEAGEGPRSGEPDAWGAPYAAAEPGSQPASPPPGLPPYPTQTGPGYGPGYGAGYGPGNGPGYGQVLGAPYGYPPYGYGYQPQPPTGTNGMAVAALVLGICGFFFVTPIIGLILGLVALSSVRRTGQKGKGLAISGIVLSSLWIALFATLITVAVIIAPDPAQRDANGNVVKAGAVPVFQLHVKDCFTLPAGALGSSDNNTRTLKVVPCSTPHDSEAFGFFDATETSFPGADGLRTDGMSQCVQKLAGYVPDPASLPSRTRVQFIYPNEQAWDQGERRVTCFVQFPAATMTQSVQRDLSSYNADQARFLNAVNPLAEAISELSSLPDSADLSTLQQRAGAISNAAQAESTALTAQPWPADVQALVNTFAVRQSEMGHLWARAAGESDESSFEDDARQANAAFDQKDMQAIRAALGLTAVAGGSSGGQAAA